VPLLALGLRAWLAPRPPTFKFSRTRTAQRVGGGLAARLAHLPDGLRLAAALLLVVALARPQSSRLTDRVEHRGIDIAIALDLSESMQADDLFPNRLEAAKEVIDQFIARRAHDRVGMVAFGAYASTVSPLTIDHNVLRQLVRRLQLGGIDGTKTAIGAGLGLALNRLKDSDADSQVIVLLTDGVHNAEGIDPDSAAQEAKDRGIAIYTVLIGRHLSASVDPGRLERIASLTGGYAYTAEDQQALVTTFQDLLNKLEKLDDPGRPRARRAVLLVPVAGAVPAAPRRRAALDPTAEVPVISWFAPAAPAEAAVAEAIAEVDQSLSLFDQVVLGRWDLAWLFVLVPLVAFGYLWAARQRRRALTGLGNQELVMRLVGSVHHGNRLVIAVVTTLAMLCLVVAMLRPQYGGTTRIVPVGGLDVVLVVDYSKSMLAKDVYPSRSERLAAELTRYLDEAERRGDQTGLVVFAGAARGLPVSRDTRILKLYLDKADPRTENPGRHGDRQGAQAGDPVPGRRAQGRPGGGRAVAGRRAAAARGRPDHHLADGRRGHDLAPARDGGRGGQARHSRVHRRHRLEERRADPEVQRRGPARRLRHRRQGQLFDDPRRRGHFKEDRRGDRRPVLARRARPLRPRRGVRVDPRAHPRPARRHGHPPP
jgi:Ca-activated chloride channel family protein